MISADQFHFNFEAAEAERLLMDYEKAQSDQWTTESMAMHWAGIHHKDHWESLPRYERARIVNLYEYEQWQLEWAIERWEPEYEVFYPGGNQEVFPPKPFRIRDFKQVSGFPISQQELDDFNARAKEMADQLSADWSANRPPSVFTYDPILASKVSLILGRKVEAILPRPEDRWGVPVSWQLLTALKQNRQ